MGNQRAITLQIDKLTTGYGTRQILDKIDLEITTGEVVAIIGHNGAGKSTLLKAIFGLLPVWSGSVVLGIEPVVLEPRAQLRRGVAYAPQGSRVFHRLSVLENLLLSAVVLNAADRQQVVERAFHFFPTLRNRVGQRAGTLSGGEKQLLALACAISRDPKFLLLDEPSLGLSPALAKSAMDRIAEIAKEADVGCLVVEQKVRQVLRISDRAYALRGGKVVFEGAAAELANETTLRRVYL